MSIVVEPVYSISNINTNKYYTETPFTARGDLVYVLSTWWNRLMPTHILLIRRNFGEKYGYAVRSNIERHDNDQDNDAFWKFYNAYIDTFTVDQWYLMLDSPNMITGFDDASIKGLKELSTRCNNRYKKLKEIDVEFFTKHTRDVIELFLKEHTTTGVFMKLSDTSGKRSNAIQPRFSFLEIIEEIVNNRDFVQCFTRHHTRSCMLLTPWRCEINKNNEFRVIVHNRHVSAISQQQCYKYSGINAYIAENVAIAISEWHNRVKHDIPYVSYVMDMWVDDNGSHLIEINPGEMWSTSGSGLFNWEIDRVKIEQDNVIYIRYIDISSPMLRGKCPSINSSLESLDLSIGSSLLK